MSRSRGVNRRRDGRIIPMRHLALSGVIALGAVAVAGCAHPVNEVRTGGTAVPETLFELPAGEMTVQLVADSVPVVEIVMEALDGRVLTMGNLRGKVTLVNFWATWCGPCRQEIPDLIALQARYPDRLQIVGVSTDEGDSAKVAAFAREWGMNYPVVMMTPEINRQFPGVFALPTSFIVDTDGGIVQTHVGLINPAIFEQEIRHLTSLPTAVNVELIEGTQQMKLVNAAHATSIPGLDLSQLTPAQKARALQRLNEEGCVCGCRLTLAQCRINDAACGLSLPLAEKVVEEIAGV